ncbi:hypothetical protein SGGMMB4_03073 [Sodalis glossinidius str. 'morsitans']|uniref:Uncharacterized protein n=1 Tax=Sodalis glossinidius (strain morsitans) TaxID=343509 RepID=Q2NT71_SODGM|nr:hypothetical protein [Sodalis glossinidius]BAE74654.1 hypothetical protein SG1379 [Sodalis glossinidius str. 'morsitans']CRL45397.1 hypothetical protein SGGMMB4_03073 [Sodalis glossinidius str. 'morsitans']
MLKKTLMAALVLSAVGSSAVYAAGAAGTTTAASQSASGSASSSDASFVSSSVAAVASASDPEKHRFLYINLNHDRHAVTQLATPQGGKQAECLSHLNRHEAGFLPPESQGNAPY